MTMKDRWKNFKRTVRLPFEWLGIGLGVLILSSLSHKWLFRVCDLISAVMYMFDDRGKRRSLQNLRIAFGKITPEMEYVGGGIPYNPTKREETIIRRSYRNMARTVGHAFWTCRDARRRVESVGEMCESCKAFLAANKPAVTVSGHILPSWIPDHYQRAVARAAEDCIPSGCRRHEEHLHHHALPLLLPRLPSE